MTEALPTAGGVHGRAQRLRRDQTDAEKLLWSRLRGGQLAGERFRRQFPIGEFIVDFCARSKRVVIELDGGQHAEQVEKDNWRTKKLEERGYRVIRLWNNEVLTNLDGVLEVIATAVGAKTE